MNQERDKFLTRAMGKCWHEGIKTIHGGKHGHVAVCQCTKTSIVKSTRELNGSDFVFSQDINFSDPSGFFILWNWAKEQSWWGAKWGNTTIAQYHINPDNFANAVYTYLKELDK